MHSYEYPRPAVTVDALVFWLQEQDLQVLLIKRKNDPFKGCWSFPGGFLDMEETPEAAAVRELEEETGLKVDDVVQIGAFGAPDRDPRGRTISIAFLSILTEAPAEVKGADDAAEACWFSVHDMPIRLAFDHKEMMQQAKVFTDMYFRTAMAGSDEAFQLSHSQIDQLLNHVS